MFVQLYESFCLEIKFGNDSTVAVMGKGNIAIKLKDRSHNYISNVFYVPNLNQIFLSMRQLSEKGYDMRIRDNTWTISEWSKRTNCKDKNANKYLVSAKNYF